jgi:hypothetical protein
MTQGAGSALVETGVPQDLAAGVDAPPALCLRAASAADRFVDFFTANNVCLLAASDL